MKRSILIQVQIQVTSTIHIFPLNLCFKKMKVELISHVKLTNAFSYPLSAITGKMAWLIASITCGSLLGLVTVTGVMAGATTVVALNLR